MVRFKNRYVLYEVIWKDKRADESINEASLLTVFRDSLATNFGDHGLASSAMALTVKYYNPVTNLCMLRCGLQEYRQVWCALSMISEISNRRLMLRFLHLGGTLKTCQQAANDYNKHLLRDLHPTQQDYLFPLMIVLTQAQQSKILQQAESKLSNLEL